MKRLLWISTILFSAAAGAWIGGRTQSDVAIEPRSAQPPLQRTSVDAALAYTIRHESERDRPYTQLLSALLEPRMLGQRHKLYEAIGSLTSAEINGLITRAEKLPIAYRDDVVAALVERWFEVDPDAARAWVARRGNWRLAQIRARCEPERCIDEIFASRSKSYTSTDVDSLQTAIAELAGTDPAEKMAWIKSLPGGTLRDQVASRLLFEWGVHQPVAALQALGAIGDAKSRDTTRSELFRMLAAKDPLKAFDLARVVASELDAGVIGHRMLTQIAEAAADKDPKAALEFAQSLPEAFRYYPAMAGARALAKTDPLEALNWCVKNGIDVARGLRTGTGGWSGAVLKEAMLNHPQETIDWVTKIAPAAERDRLLERAFYERLNNLPAEKLFAEGDDYVLGLYHQLPAEARPRTADDLSRQRATRPDFTDPEQWLAQFRTPEERASGIYGAIMGVSSRDTQQAQLLAESFTAPRDRDAALRALVVMDRWNKPDAASERAMQIHDPLVRKDALQQLIPTWMNRDKTACQAWLAEHQQAVPQQWVDRWTAGE